MLQGFSDQLEEIEESTIDANKEFTQNLMDSLKSEFVTSHNIKFNFDITDISIVDINNDIFSIYNKFTTFSFSDNIVYFLMNEESNDLLHSQKQKEEIKSPSSQNNNNTSNESYVVEIEDCDGRKTIFKEELDNLKIILNVELKLTVRIGTKIMLLKDIVNIDIGTTVELEQLASEPLDLLINGVKIAEGEVVVVEGKFGIQIVNINSKVERLSKLKFKN